MLTTYMEIRVTCCNYDNSIFLFIIIYWWFEVDSVLGLNIPAKHLLHILDCYGSNLLWIILSWSVNSLHRWWNANHLVSVQNITLISKKTLYELYGDTACGMKSSLLWFSSMFSVSYMYLKKSLLNLAHSVSLYLILAKSQLQSSYNSWLLL